MIAPQSVNQRSIADDPIAYNRERRDSLMNNSRSHLNEFDVLCGRDKTAFNHAGNRRFRVAVALHQERYAASNSRKDKSVIIRSVMKMVRMNGGRFLRWKQGTLHELSEKESHEKVGHAFRDMVLSSKKTIRSQKRKSSNMIPTIPLMIKTGTSPGRVVSPPTIPSNNDLFEPLPASDLSLPSNELPSPPSTESPLDAAQDPLEPIPSCSPQETTIEQRDTNDSNNDPFAIFDKVSVTELVQALDLDGSTPLVDSEREDVDDFNGDDSLDETMLHWLMGESDELIQHVSI